MQDQDSTLYDDCNFRTLKSLLDDKVNIGCIVSAIEQRGICGRDFYDRMRSYSPKEEGSREAIGSLAYVQRWHAQALLDGDTSDEKWSRGNRKSLRNFGWYRHEMPDFENFRTTYPPFGSVEKPFSTKERNTYLKVIAALCKHCKIDTSSRSAVGELRIHTEEIGLPVSSDTLRKILNELKDALE